MLQLFRKKKSWLKWVLLLGIIAIGATTALMFVDTPTGLTQGAGGQHVAVVAGDSIGITEFRRQYQQMIDLYRQLYNLDDRGPEIIKQLGIGQQALNQLISEYAIRYEAENLGISASPQEIADRIRQFPAFQENGLFIGTERYRQVLQANNFTVKEFEDAITREIIRNKFRGLITDGVLPTPQEIRQEYVNRTQEVKIEYVLVDPSRVEPPQPSEDELRKYYEEGQESYRIPEERKIRYVIVDSDPTQVQLTETAIQEALGGISREEKVRARHILIKTENRDEETARSEARKILEQIRAGGDFPDLARKHSEDTASATQGGDLGFFTRGQMVPEFEQTAFSLQPGEVSDLVRSTFGFHIIKVEEKPKLDEESLRQQAAEEARQKAAAEEAHLKARRLVQQVTEGSALQEAAAALGKEVQESEYFPSTGSVSGLEVGPDFVQNLFSLEAAGKTTAPYQLPNGYVVAQIADIRPSQIPEFEQVRDRVAADFRSEKREEAGRQRAFELSRQAREDKSITTAAREFELATVQTGFFKKNRTIDETLTYAAEVHEQAFRMQEGEISPPIPLSGKYVIFQLVEKSRIDESDFQEKIKEIRADLEQQKRNQFFGAYVENLVSKLRREDQITINQPLLDQLTS